MDEETLNIEIRKFLKKVGVSAQREMENAVRDAVAKGKLGGGQKLAVKYDAGDPAAWRCKGR